MTSFVQGRLRPSHAQFRVAAAALAMTVAALTWVFLTSATVGSPAGAIPSGASAPAAAPPAASASLSPELARLAATRPAQRVEVIIQLARGVAPSRARALVRSVGGRPGLELHIINGLSARLSAGAARRLAVSPLVHAVSLNALVKETSLVDFAPWRLATVFNQSVTAPRLWNHGTGKGVGVAVIDTGITGDLPDFRSSQSDTKSRVIASMVADPGATTASDTYGHGTDVGGLVAGNGGYRDSGDPLWGRYAGSAPDANLISVKISGDDNTATTLNAIYGLQFAVDHKADYNIRVVNMSFRSTSSESYHTDPLDAAAEQAWFDGIVVVTAAGNMGSAPDAVSYAPGNDPYVITVGAADDQGTRWSYDDAQTSWSSQGVTQDGFSKPDVLAPGAHIVSTLAPGSAFASLCSSCIIGDNYFQASGTSMAAPIVSGVVADLLSAHPSWTPDMIKGAIANTAVRLDGGGSEVRGIAAYWAGGDDLASNQGLTPNTLVDPDTGTIDYTAASWSAASWNQAADPLAASWSAASWSCSNCVPGTSDVNPTAASWNNVGWTTMWG